MVHSKVWFITGASSGFGREATEYLLDRGNIVVATLRKPEAIEDIRARYSEDKLLVIKLDVTRQAEITEAFLKARSAFGRIDIVFNNAGYGVLAEAEGTLDEAARALFETNFWGAVNVSKEAMSFFRDVNKPAGGRLLNVSSTVGIAVYPLMGFYTASKHALEGFTKTLALEIDPDWHIKVTLIEFGMFRTKIAENNVKLEPHPSYTKPTLPSVMMRDQLALANLVLTGDVRRAIVKVDELTRLESPPLHLPLGTDSVEEIKKELASVSAEVHKYESWSRHVALDRHQIMYSKL